MIRLTTKNFENIRQRLNDTEQAVMSALVKAHSELDGEAVTRLKQGLSQRAGRDAKSPDYQNSPKGALPYGHTLRLRDSIGFKILLGGKKITSEVGSGAKNAPIHYAKYLEGRDGDGIRPFLWYIEPIYTVHNLLSKFWQNFRAEQAKGAR